MNSLPEGEVVIAIVLVGCTGRGGGCMSGHIGGRGGRLEDRRTTAHVTAT